MRRRNFIPARVHGAFRPAASWAVAYDDGQAIAFE